MCVCVYICACVCEFNMHICSSIYNCVSPSHTTGQTVPCTIGKGAVHLLQMNLYLVAAQLVAVCSRTVWGLSSQKAEKIDKICTALSILVPSIALLATYLSPYPTCEDENFEVVKFRLSFTCFPFMKTMLGEWMVTWSHFVLGSVLICILVSLIMSQFLKMGSQVGPGSVSANSPEAKGRRGSVSGVFGAGVKLMSIHRYMKKGTEKLILLGVISAVLLIVNLVVNIATITQYEEFKEMNVPTGDENSMTSQELQYFRCVNNPQADTIEGLAKLCGQYTTKKLPSSLLALGFFATSFTTFCFVGVFAWDKKNFKMAGTWFRKNVLRSKEVPALKGGSTQCA